MTKATVLKISVSVLFFLYPFLVYLGLQEFQPQWLAVFLVIIAALRLLAWQSDKRMSAYWMAAAVLVALITLFTGSSIGLYLYPVMVNLIFFSFFFISLYRPPTVIERLARQFQAELSPEGVQYTRTVTKIWCVFFLINGLLSIISLQVSEQWWLLYNGFIAYCLMGLLFVCEYLTRRRVMRAYDA